MQYAIMSESLKMVFVDVHDFFETCGKGFGDKYSQTLEENGFSLKVLEETETEDLPDLFGRLENEDRMQVVKYVEKTRNVVLEDCLHSNRESSAKNENEEAGAKIPKEQSSSLSKSNTHDDLSRSIDHAIGESDVASDVKVDDSVEQKAEDLDVELPSISSSEQIIEEECATLRELEDTNNSEVWVTKVGGGYEWVKLELKHVFKKSGLILVADSSAKYNREYERFNYSEFHWRLTAPKGWKESEKKKSHQSDWLQTRRKRAAQKPVPQKRKRLRNPFQRKEPRSITIDSEKMKEIVTEMKEALAEYERPPRPKKKKKRILGDLEKYQQGYPANDKEYNYGEEEMVQRCKNLLFYKGLLRSKPDNCTIMDFHEEWFGKYRELEFGHGFIQWLFPIREQGLNHQAHKLYPHEMLVMRKSPEIRLRLFKSYQLILDFFGMKLVNGSGLIERTSDYKSNYQNLNQSYHNYLRITRILKCLGEMGMEKYQAPFLVHMLNEMFVNNKLMNCRQSCEKYWIPTLRDEKMRKLLLSVYNKKPKQRVLAVKGIVQSFVDDNGLLTGMQARIDYLEGETLAPFNGKVGTLMAFESKKDKWAVQFADSGARLIKASHLTRLEVSMEEEVQPDVKVDSNDI